MGLFPYFFLYILIAGTLHIQLEIFQVDSQVITMQLCDVHTKH